MFYHQSIVAVIVVLIVGSQHGENQNQKQHIKKWARMSATTITAASVTITTTIRNSVIEKLLWINNKKKPTTINHQTEITTIATAITDIYKKYKKNKNK